MVSPALSCKMFKKDKKKFLKNKKKPSCLLMLKSCRFLSFNFSCIIGNSPKNKFM